MNRVVAKLPQVARQGTRKASASITTPQGYIEGKAPNLKKIKDLQAAVQVDINKAVYLKYPADKSVFLLSAITTLAALGSAGHTLFGILQKYNV